MKLFLHMPKTAGTTLVNVFQKTYGNDRVYREPVNYAKDRALAEAFLRLPAEERSRIEILCGHFRVGFHTLLHEDVPYMTVLRDPVDRIISLYYYWREHPSEDWMGFTRKYNNLSEFIRSGVTSEVDNGMTRAIAGRDLPIPFGGCSRDLLEQAKQNLREKFCFVGLTERFPESLVLMKGMLAWSRVPLYESLNATRDRPSKDDVNTADRDALLEYTEYDRELYAFAEERFNELVARQDSVFAYAVETLIADSHECQELCRSHIERVNEITSTRFWRWSRPVVRLLHPGMKLLPSSQKRDAAAGGKIASGWKSNRKDVIPSGGSC